MPGKYHKSTPEEIATEPDARKRARKRWYRNNKGKIERKRKIMIAMNYEAFRDADNEYQRKWRRNNLELARRRSREANRKRRAKLKANTAPVVAAVNDKLARLKARPK